MRDGSEGGPCELISSRSIFKVVFAVKSWLGEEARLQLSPYMAAEHAHKIHLLDGRANKHKLGGCSAT